MTVSKWLKVGKHNALSVDTTTSIDSEQYTPPLRLALPWSPQGASDTMLNPPKYHVMCLLNTP